MGVKPSDPDSAVRRARLIGGLIPIVGIVGAIVLAVWLGTLGWAPRWLPSGRFGILLAFPVSIVVAAPLFVAMIAWESRLRAVPESLRELLSGGFSDGGSNVTGNDLVLGRVTAGLITSAGGHFGPVVVLTAGETGLRIDRSRWPAFGAGDIGAIDVPWSAVESVQRVGLSAPRAAFAFVVKTSRGAFAVWSAPLRADRVERLLTRPRVSG